MAQKKDISLLEETIKNCRTDRQQTQFFLSQLLKHVGENVDRQRDFGLIAAKYLETLQRSNEQMVKVALVINKKEMQDAALSDEDKEDLFDTIKEDKE